MYGSSAAHVPGRCWYGNNDDGCGNDGDVMTALTIRADNICRQSSTGAVTHLRVDHWQAQSSVQPAGDGQDNLLNLC